MFHCGESFGDTFHSLSNLVKCVANSFPSFKIGHFEGVISHPQWNHIPMNLCFHYVVVLIELIELLVLEVPGQIGHILPMGMWGGSVPQMYHSPVFTKQFPYSLWPCCDELTIAKNKEKLGISGLKFTSNLHVEVSNSNAIIVFHFCDVDL